MKTNDRKKPRSLTVILSVIVAAVIVVVFSIFVFVVRSTVIQLAEDSYTNQLLNFNKSIERQLVTFFDTQVRNVKFLAKNPTLVRAMQTGDYTNAGKLLKDYFEEGQVYEEVFISTPEQNSLIVASGSSRATGIRWGNIPIYRENSEAAIKGEVHVGSVGKSPATGLPVILITAPIMVDNRVIGVVGLPVDVGKYSGNIVNNIVIGKTGYPYLTDLNGVTFAHPVAKNIFKLNLQDFAWGREILAKESGSVVKYEWEGKLKIQTFIKNQKYRFISAATIYVDDFMAAIRERDMILFPIAVVLILISSILIFLFMRKRLKPLKTCENIMGDMASGNLSSRFTDDIPNDEIGRIASALNMTLEQFEKLISDVITSSQNLAQAVQEIASGNENLSQRTAEQASSLEEIASTIEEATATIRQTADTATEATKLSDRSSTVALEGGKVADEAVTAIHEINVSSTKIADIISMINEIAFQTNLLALNAAVEAARAGQQGRGFAVVAGEVRNLAQRAGAAVKEIGDLIRDSQGRVEKGTELVNKTGETLKEIIETFQQVSQLVNEIAAASQEQRQGIDQINIAVTEMDSMTQQNASLVEETASASEEMSNQAQELLDMVNQFSLSEKFRQSISGTADPELEERNPSVRRIEQ
ncbi:MAG TPA: methyl-accepting chemotaxis protein [Spirochaetota bacterium]|nr:methyl-accepting chemotaxis protein [Spirochaetota bacterium]